jgi:hypothetical protein
MEFYTAETESTIEVMDKIIVTNIIPIAPAGNSFFLDIGHAKAMIVIAGKKCHNIKTYQIYKV